MHQSPENRAEFGEQHPLNRHFRRIFREFSVVYQAEYLLERYADSSDFSLVDRSRVRSFVSDSLWGDLLTIMAPNRAEGHLQAAGLKHSIIAAGETSEHIYLAIASRNDSDEMVLQTTLEENGPRVRSSNDFCGHFAVINKTNKRAKQIGIIATAISPDLAEHEITRFVNGDFSGAIGQRVRFALSGQNAGQRIERILFSTDLVADSSLFDNTITKSFGVKLEGGALVTFNVRCDKRLFWEIHGINIFRSDAKAQCSEIFKKTERQKTPSTEINYLSHFWKAEIEDCAKILEEGLLKTVARDCLRDISGMSQKTPFPTPIKKARFNKAFILPHKGLLLDHEPLVSYMRLFLKYLDSLGKSFVPSKSGSAVESDCSVVVDLSWSLGRQLPKITPFGLFFSAEAMKTELLKVISKDHDSILRPYILEVIKKQDPRFKEAEIDEISYRISTPYYNPYSDSDIVFAVQHQFGLSLVHLSRIGKTNLISFTDSWILLGALDHFKRQKS